MTVEIVLSDRGRAQTNLPWSLDLGSGSNSEGAVQGHDSCSLFASLYLIVVRADFSTYVPGSSFVHALDARVKVVLLAIYATSSFFVASWPGLALFAGFFAAAFIASDISARRLLLLAFPVYVLVLLTVLLNSFAAGSPGFGFSEAGFARACFFGSRIILLTWALLLVGFATSSIELMGAFSLLLAPLKKAGVPVDDVVTALSIALRFIPLAVEELFRVRDAQRSRGGRFDEGGPLDRSKAWAAVLLPLIMGMFRRAEGLSLAMDARCYGAVSGRTALDGAKARSLDAFVLAAGAVACMLVAWIF